VQFDDAGAITGWSKIVLVRPAWLRLDTPWLSCRAFLGNGTDQVRLSWQDNATLMVRHGFAPDEVIDAPQRCGQTRILTVFDHHLISEDL